MAKSQLNSYVLYLRTSFPRLIKFPPSHKLNEIPEKCNKHQSMLLTYILYVVIDVSNSIFSDSSHGICLTTTGLAVCKNRCCTKKKIKILGHLELTTKTYQNRKRYPKLQFAGYTCSYHSFPSVQIKRHLLPLLHRSC